MRKNSIRESCYYEKSYNAYQRINLNATQYEVNPPFTTKHTHTRAFLSLKNIMWDLLLSLNLFYGKTFGIFKAS